MESPTEAASSTTTEEYPRYRWVLVSQVWMHWSFGQIIFQTLGIFLPAMQADLGFGAAEAGWLGSLRAVGQLLLFPASIVLVRFKPYRVYGVLLTVAAVAQFFQGVAPELAVLMIALVIHGIAISWTQITGAFVRLQWVPPRELGTVTGMQMAAGAITTTVLLAGGPFMIDQFGWRAVILMMDGMLAVLAVLWWITKRERITKRYEAAMSAKLEWQNVVTTLRHREFWLLGGAIMGGGGTYFTTVTFLPSYFTADRGMPLTTAGAIVSLIPIGGLVASLTTGFLSDRLGLRKPFIWSAGLVLPALYLTMLLDAPIWVLSPVALLIGYFAFAPFVMINVIPFELNIPPREVAMGLSLQQTIGTIGQLSLPIMVGLIASSFSYRTGLLSIVAFPLAFALICLFLPETGPRGHSRKEA